MTEPRIGNILCLNKAIQYSSKRTRYCTYNKTISLRHSYLLYTKEECSNVRYYPYAYVNGCSVPAGQPATKGPYSPRDTMLVVPG